MASLGTLVANGAGTYGTRDWGGNQTYTNLESISGADGDYIATSVGNNYTETTSFTLGTIPSDIDVVTAVSWQVRYRQSAAQGGDDSLVLRIRIVDSSGTVLAAADSGGTYATVYSGTTANFPSSFTNSSVTPFSYVSPTAGQTEWDTAHVQLQVQQSKSGGPDNTAVWVDALEFTGTYTPTAPTITVTPGVVATTTAVYLPTVTTAVTKVADPVATTTAVYLPSVQGDVLLTYTSGSGTDASAGVSITLPTHASGDLLLVFIAVDLSLVATLSASGSWVEHAENARGGEVDLGIYALIASSGSETCTITSTNAEEYAYIAVVVPAAQHGFTAESEIESTAFTGNTASQDPGSLTPTWGSTDLWLTVIGADSTPGASVLPTSYGGQELIYELDQGNVAIIVGGEATTASTLDPSTWTLNATEQGVTYNIGIKPSMGTVVPSGVVATTTAVYLPTVTTAVTKVADSVATTTAVYLPTVQAVTTIVADPVSLTTTVELPTITTAVTLDPGVVATTTAVNLPTVTTAVTIDPGVVATRAWPVQGWITLGNAWSWWIRTNDAVPLGTSNRFYAARVRWASVPTSPGYFMFHKDTTRDVQLSIEANTGDLNFNYNNGTGWAGGSSDSGPVFTNGEWVWLGVEVEQSGADVLLRFYTGGDGVEPSWSQTGSQVTVSSSTFTDPDLDTITWNGPLDFDFSASFLGEGADLDGTRAFDLRLSRDWDGTAWPGTFTDLYGTEVETPMPLRGPTVLTSIPVTTTELVSTPVAVPLPTVTTAVTKTVGVVGTTSGVHLPTVLTASPALVTITAVELDIVYNPLAGDVADVPTGNVATPVSVHLPTLTVSSTVTDAGVVATPVTVQLPTVTTAVTLTAGSVPTTSAVYLPTVTTAVSITLTTVSTPCVLTNWLEIVDWGDYVYAEYGSAPSPTTDRFYATRLRLTDWVPGTFVYGLWHIGTDRDTAQMYLLADGDVLLAADNGSGYTTQRFNLNGVAADDEWAWIGFTFEQSGSDLVMTLYLGGSDLTPSWSQWGSPVTKVGVTLNTATEYAIYYSGGYDDASSTPHYISHLFYGSGLDLDGTRLFDFDLTEDWTSSSTSPGFLEDSLGNAIYIEGEVLGAPQPTVTTAVTITAGSVATTTAVNLPTVTTALSLDPGSVATTVSVHLPTVTTAVTLDPGNVATPASVHLPTVLAVVTKVADSVPTTIAVYLPTVTTAVTIRDDPLNVTATSAVHLPTVLVAVTEVADSVPTPVTVHLPTVTTAVTITADPVATPISVYLPTYTEIEQPQLTVVPTPSSVHLPTFEISSTVTDAGVVATPASVHLPAVQTDDVVTVQVDPVATPVDVLLPTLTTATSLTLDLVPTSVSVELPTVTTAVTIDPGSVPTTTSVHLPTLTTAVTLDPGTVATPISVHLPTVTTAVTITAGSVATPSSVYLPTFTTTATFTIGSVPTPVDVLLPTVQTDSGVTVLADPVELLTTVELPTVTTSVTLTADVVATPASVHLPTVQTDSTVTVSADPVQLAAAVHLPTLTTAVTIAPDPIATLASVLLPTVSTASETLVAADPVALVTSVYLPTLTSAVTLDPGSVTTPVTVELPTITSSPTVVLDTVATPVTIPAAVVEIGITAGVVATSVSVYAVTITADATIEVEPVATTALVLAPTTGQSYTVTAGTVATTVAVYACVPVTARYPGAASWVSEVYAAHLVHKAQTAHSVSEALSPSTSPVGA